MQVPYLLEDFAVDSDANGGALVVGQKPPGHGYKHLELAETPMAVLAVASLGMGKITLS